MEVKTVLIKDVFSKMNVNIANKIESLLSDFEF
jgi:hypothetical protein